MDFYARVDVNFARVYSIAIFVILFGRGFDPAVTFPCLMLRVLHEYSLGCLQLICQCF